MNKYVKYGIIGAVSLTIITAFALIYRKKAKDKTADAPPAPDSAYGKFVEAFNSGKFNQRGEWWRTAPCPTEAEFNDMHKKWAANFKEAYTPDDFVDYLFSFKSPADWEMNLLFDK